MSRFPDPSQVSLPARTALVSHGLRELHRHLGGFFVIERLLRPPIVDEDADRSELDLFREDLATLLGTLNQTLADQTNFLISLAEANQKEMLQ